MEKTMVKNLREVVILKGEYPKDGNLGVQIEIALKHLCGGDCVFLCNVENVGEFEKWKGVLASTMTTEELLHKAIEVAYRLFPFSTWDKAEINATENGFAIGKIVEIEA